MPATRLRLRRRWSRAFASLPAALTERTTTVNGVQVFYRESTESTEPRGSRGSRGSRAAGDSSGRPVMVHLHGFGMSSRYLVPTAELLAPDLHTFVPDLPGCGRSGRPAHPQDIPDLAHDVAAFLDDEGVRTATLLGHSVGCAVVTEFARLHPERLDRAILVSPAGGTHNQPLHRAIGQVTLDGFREPVGLWPVAMADYARFGVRSTVRLFRTLTQYASLDRLLELQIPTLVVVGDRDPLLPGPVQLERVAGQSATSAIVVVVEGAAHALNFSHPDQLANDHPPLPGRRAHPRRSGHPRRGSHVRAAPGSGAELIGYSRTTAAGS